MHALYQEYYTVHGVDANFVAREMFKSEGVLRYFCQGRIVFSLAS